MQLPVCIGAPHHACADRTTLFELCCTKITWVKNNFPEGGILKGRWKTEEVILKSKDGRKLSQLGHGWEMDFSIILPVYHKLEVWSKHCNRVSTVRHLQWLCSYCLHDSLFPHIKAKDQILNYWYRLTE